MPLGSESLRVVIAGATSIRGKDLKQCMDEGSFPAGEIRLLDEDFAAGTLTDVGGEPAVVQTVDEASFERARFVFFTGSRTFIARHAAAARLAGAAIIDLSGGLNDAEGASPWIPKLDGLLPPPRPNTVGTQVEAYLAPTTPAIVACSFAAALAELPVSRLVLVFFQPVSERGQQGVDELESQTTKLLTLQPISQTVFDAQVAFNLLDRWGPESAESLSDVRLNLAQEVRRYLHGRTTVPAMTVIQAPVFFGHGYAAFAEFTSPQQEHALAERLAAAGFNVSAEGDGPSNISVAGETQPAIGRPEADANTAAGYWFWGAADNLRVASANAVRIAERLLAS